MTAVAAANGLAALELDVAVAVAAGVFHGARVGVDGGGVLSEVGLVWGVGGHCGCVVVVVLGGWGFLVGGFSARVEWKVGVEVEGRGYGESCGGVWG